jgi:predicted phosphodiesterase
MSRSVAVLFLLVFAATLRAQTILVQPYVQPGNGANLVGSDVKVIAWLTDQTPGDFEVEFTVENSRAEKVQPERTTLDFAAPAEKPRITVPVSLEELLSVREAESAPNARGKQQHYFKYAAQLAGLPFNSTVQYRVLLDGHLVTDGSFRTRATPEKTIRFAAVGDLAQGRAQQNAIAYQMWKAQPDFLVALGDIVYPSGRVSQYLRYFWNSYNNVAAASPLLGAPLMRSVPVYAVLGNHDVDARLPETPDALGAFYFFHPPLNGPGLGSWSLQLGKDGPTAAAFRKNVGSTYPALSVYSFDYGPAHFLVLDSNIAGSKFSQRLLSWIERDLRGTRQPWKFVCLHAPSFHTSPGHYTQKFRLLEPLFASAGVDVVFAGHVHNYQRSKPLRFTPDPGIRDKRGRVNGNFVLDEKFDGQTNTTPQGIIHIVSGGGGAALYDSIDRAGTVARLEQENTGNWVPFTAKYVADRHSFSLVELSAERFTLRQISADGEEVDRFTITKPRSAAAVQAMPGKR